MMSDDKIKIEELRLLFDREFSRKQHLENKASYFLAIISIITTTICTFISFMNPFSKFNSIFGYVLGIVLILLIIITFYCYISIFLPRNHYHPFDINNFDELYKSFKVSNIKFKNNLYEQYLTSIYINYQLNEDINFYLKISICSFFAFLIILILCMVIL